MEMMDRNRDRMYYDKGYRDGVKDTKRDSRVPKVIGVAGLLAVSWVDVYAALAVFIMWAAFELTEYRDECKYHESDPPAMWED